MSISNKNVNDDDDHHATTVICGSKDDFVLSQDLCMSCGTFGEDEEGQLIVCSQCGQCYHPYCASVKVKISIRAELIQI